MKKKIIILGVAIVGVIVFFLGMGITKETVINLSDYIKVEFSGYDTVGHAVVSFEEEAFLEKYGDVIEIKDMDERVSNLREMHGNAAQPAYLMLRCIDYQLDKVNELSNGDIVTVKWEYDDEIILKEFGCRLICENESYTVSNLGEIVEYDPFEDVEITYFGDIYPDIYVEMSNNTSKIEEINYYFDKNSGFNKGEKVILHVGPENIEEICLDKYGLKLTCLDREYELPQDLPEYICDFGQMSSDEITKMKSLCEAVIIQETEVNYDDPEGRGEDYVSLKVTPLFKEAVITSSHNVYVGYKVTYDFIFAGKEYSKIKYIYAVFDALIRNVDGEIEEQNLHFWGVGGIFYRNTAWEYLGPGAPTYNINLSGDYGAYDEYYMRENISDSIESTYEEYEY